ncbi:quinate transport [Fusarium albosuccineum]|uniref:Quinate transport n=1 Tax=Fusarium albosuccineum TaxID=1237068 RepID=A0A8H4L5H6_9HYPO|nr:quinate transport [Fusarium albosuccineum]
MGVVVKLLRKIVRNDAMKTDPTEIYNWRVFALVCASCFGGMLFGWDTGAIGGVLAMEATQARFGYTPEAKVTLDQNIVSTLQAGCFLACFFTSWLTEKFGRRWCLIGTGTVTTIGVVFQAASTANGSLPVMYVGRFVAGLGVGAASTLVPLYVSECAPRAIRGGLTSFYQLFIVTGVMLSFWINYGSLLHLKAPAIFTVPLALQALPAVFLIGGMFLAPESPRWCARKDDWERATRILTTLRMLPEESEYVQNEIQEMSAQLEAERRLTGDASASTLWKEMVTIPGNRKRAILSVMLMVCQQMTGVNAVNYYAPQIFQALGMTGTSVSLFATGVYGIVKVAGCATFLVFAADSLGRRRSLLWTSVAQAVTMFIIGIYGRVEPPVKGQDISAFGYVAIVCIYLWAAVFQFGWGPCCWILVSEIPTARLRALNVAIGAATQWLFNFIIARTVLTMQKTMGTAGYGMFFMFGCFGVLMGLFVWFFIPETKGLSLEQMDELFGVVEMAKKLDAENPEIGRPTSIREEHVNVKDVKQ